MTKPFEAIRILGIDPGSINTGYGLIESSGSTLKVIDFGTWSPEKIQKTPLEFHQKLDLLFQKITNCIQEHQPQVIAIEKIFFSTNAHSTIQLGQVRGVMLLAAARAGLTIAEYSPNEVKGAVAQHGHAGKDQMAKMVSLILGCKDFPTSDASDALAIAITHALHSQRGGIPKTRLKNRKTMAESVAHRLLDQSK